MDGARIAAENLSVWREAAAQNRELRHLQIGQMAKEVAAATDAVAEPSPSLLPNVLRERDDDATPLEDRVAERLAFCKALLAAAPHLLPPSISGKEPPAAPRVAVLSGPVFSLALSRFFAPSAKVQPVILSSLTELMEETGAGNTDFALIPIEDTKGTRLLRFYEEFDRLELRILCLCRVPTENEGRGMQFALITRLYDLPLPHDATPLLECRLSCEDPRMVQELLAAAHEAGLALRRVDSLPDPYLEDSIAYFTVFFAPPTACALFELYLAICLPRAAVIGHCYRLPTAN